jgi:tight adherence protein C
MGILAALFLAPTAAVLAVAGFASRGRPVSPTRHPSRRRPDPWRRTLLPIGSVAPLARIAGPDRLAARIELSGSTWVVAEVVGLKWLLGVGALVLGLATEATLALAPLAPIAFMVPDLLLARAARTRVSAAERELPLLLDVVAAGVGAGLTGHLAVRHAAFAVDGPLAVELREALRRVDLGGRWGDELMAAAERLTLRDLHRAIAVLVSGDAMGSPLAETLEEIARESRDARRALATERARTAPVKMLFPLVFLILPAFLLLTVVPVLVTTLQSIR